MAFRLLATDLDGTLLDADLTVSPRTRAALDAARAAGWIVAPVTARQPIGVRAIAEQAGFTDWALCGNGAHGIHLGTGESLFEAHVEVAVQRALAETLSARVPDLLFVSVRDGGATFVAQDGYARVADFSDHKREPATMGSHTLTEVLAAPSLKFVVRHPTLDNDALVAEIRGLGLTGFEVTHSGAPFVEVLADGVTKAWGLEQLCAHLGIDRNEVVAFGDAPNDAEMLSWAGLGVAVANAAPVTLAAADTTTAAHTEDGVAIVIEQLLGVSESDPTAATT